MDLLAQSVKKLYFRYFAAAFGSACITCVYGIVDMAMVGQYEGPSGTAAITVVMPIFNVIYSLGLLAGIGGSVLYSAARGGGSGKAAQNEWFTTACILGAAFSLLVWVALFCFEDALLTLFGANSDLLPLAKLYMGPVRLAAPFFLASQLLAAFLRNDGAPGLATLAVCLAGVFNMVGDYVLIFKCDMGILGAGVATALGGVISVAVMASRFFSRANSLCLGRVSGFPRKAFQTLSTGFSTFFTDLSLGIVTMLFNRQIMAYFGTSALAVFGVLMSVHTFVQCCGYSAGQAAQPILSTNFGAGKLDRITGTMRYALATSLVFGLVWTALTLGVPTVFVRLFMQPTAEVLAISPGIMRAYGPAFFFMPFNVLATYYFQAVMKPGVSFAISAGRGLVLSGILIMALPAAFGATALWLAMPLAEALIFAYAVFEMAKGAKLRPAGTL